MTAKSRFLSEYPKALRDDAGAIFVGAGVSMAAGYPSWRKLLKDIGDELGVDTADVHDLSALAQWSVRKTSGYTRIRQVIKAEIGKDLPIPEAMQIIARLPSRQLWTTNYDRLIERAFAEIGRPIDPISIGADLAIRANPGSARLYKMHGSVDRLEDLVISTDDYELFRSKRGAYLPLLQAHLTSFSMLFVGLSFTDPNIRHVLSLIRESFTDAPPEHFAIVRPPQRDDFSSDGEFAARSIQHNHWSEDLLRYGLSAVEIDSYDEVPDLLRTVERRVADTRVWISGSWPLGRPHAPFIHAVSEQLGSRIGDLGLSLVSGAGLLVGSASMAGFLGSLQRSGAWDLERRLIVRPFPQAFGAATPDKAQWTLLRQELARVSGTVIFVGGMKDDNGTLVEAGGVLEEAELAQAQGARLLPIGATGGAAATLAHNLIGSAVPSNGPNKQRPSDAALRALLNDALSPSELADAAIKILTELLP